MAVALPYASLLREAIGLHDAAENKWVKFGDAAADYHGSYDAMLSHEKDIKNVIASTRSAETQAALKAELHYANVNPAEDATMKRVRDLRRAGQQYISKMFWRVVERAFPTEYNANKVAQAADTATTDISASNATDDDFTPIQAAVGATLGPCYTAPARVVTAPARESGVDDIGSAIAEVDNTPEPADQANADDDDDDDSMVEDSVRLTTQLIHPNRYVTWTVEDGLFYVS
jgi:hypothetical protein